MKNLLAICAFLLPLHLVIAQNDDGRENWLPNKGSVGIGTRTPSEDLEVIGNIKATNTIFTQGLESNSVKSGSLLLFNNALINGRLGIGVTEPTEKLDVLGNFRLQGNLYAQGLTIQSLQSTSGVFNTLTVNQNSIFNGMVGIGISPTEKLHVSGNVRIENDLFSNKFTTTFIQTSELNAGLSSFSENVSFSKDAFITGKLGIGISAPSEVLDVSGNIKSSAGLFSSSLNTGTAQLINLNVSQNSIFSGLVGIGVTTPAEKLHIGGNLKVDNTIFTDALTTTNFQTSELTATGLASFGENVTFNKDLIINGKVGIGVALPTENLEINGNVKATQFMANSLNIQEGTFNTLSVSQNSVFSGKIGIGVAIPTESLDINGNLKLTGGINAASLNAGQGSFIQGLSAGNTTVNGTLQVTGQLNAQSLSLADINATNNISAGNELTVTGLSRLNGGASVGGNSTFNNLSVSGTLNAGTIAISEVNTTRNATIGLDLTVNGKGQIGGDLSVVGRLNAQSLSLSDINSTNNVSVGKDLTVTGLSQLNGGATIGGSSTVNNLEVTGTLNAGNIGISEINTTGDATVGRNLSVQGTQQVNGDLNVIGQLNAQAVSLSDINASNNISIGNSLAVTGNSQLNGGATIVGNSSVNGDLNISGTLTAGNISFTDINTSGNATITQNLTVNGLSEMSGDLNVTGNLKAGVIEATEFRTTGGGSPFNFNNAVISETLTVAADHVPANYKMAVGGNIIAVGIDIKIPQKWPDYVFTEQHQRMTLEELQLYINKHGHLPGLASAEQMEEKQNYSVSEMDAKLLEKVEELTLYILELKKEIEALKKRD